VLGGLRRTGYRHVGWHVNPEDWRDGLTVDELERCIRDGVRDAGDGTIVLLHGWPDVTPRAVDRVLAAASGDGVTYVGIDELGAPPVTTVP
jgi:peptidoglycan/xylan/chitin deacetylase (PgdA/CDA1 family)